MRTYSAKFIAGVLLLAAVILPGAIAKAQAPTVQLAAVPWFGSEAAAHQVYSGGSIVLQAVAWLPGSPGTSVPLAGGTWDPGDGTGPVAINVSNSLALERTVTYSGSVGLIRTATIDVWDASNTHYTDTFKVVIAANTRETKVNMAIDKGLWSLHKKINRTTSDGKKSGFWQSGYNAQGFYEAATAGVVQAFEINNHRESGDVTKDPYVDDVARGLRFILSNEHGHLQAFNIGLQGGNNPDTDPDGAGPLTANGIGLGVRYNTSDHTSYMTGQVIDALVASGTPTKAAETGVATYVAGRKYKDIVMDMLDGYSYGMNDSYGGWHYAFNQGTNDTSASHWWAIGVLAANTWGLDAPAWVKNLNKNTGIPLMQAPVGYNPNGCYFGYTNNYNNFWGDNQTNVTAAGLILMNADNMPQTSARFTCAEQWLNYQWNNSMGNLYTMYQTAKAMRTAKAADGVTTSPITMLGSHDWYAEYADHLIANQNAAGEFSSTNLGPGNQIGTWVGHPTLGSRDLSSSWALIILSPSLFDVPPQAMCTASPSELGINGGLVNFDGSASTHPDPDASITNYSWNFDDGSPAGSGMTTTHNFSAPASYPKTRNVVLTVTDNKGISATASCPVKIVDDNAAPNAVNGGPYVLCSGGTLILNGSASTDPDPGDSVVSYKWSWGAVINFNAPNATGATVDASAAFNAMAPGTYQLGLQVTDTHGKTGESFTTVEVRAANDPRCNQPPTISQADVTAEATSAAGAVVSFTPTVADPNAGDVLTVSCSPASGSTFAVGQTPVSCTVSDGKGGTASTTFNVNVTKAPTTTAISCSDVVYNGSVQETCTATVSDTHGFSAAVTVAYTGDTTNVGSVSGAANFFGDSWHTGSSATASYNITPAAVTAKAGSGSSVYDGAAHAASACVVSGAYTGDLTCANSTTAGPNIGTTTISPVVSGSVLGNYTITPVDGSYAITKAVVTAKAGSGSSVYDGATHAASACVVSGAYTGDLTCDNNTTAGPNVGTTTISPVVNGSGLDNYTITPVDGSYTITRAAVTAKAGSGSSVYDGATHAAAACVVSGPYVGDLTCANSPATVGPNVGTTTTSPVVSGTGQDNFTIATVDGSYSITKAPSTTVVTCTSPQVYTGSAITACSARVTGAGNLDQSVTPVSYTDNVNVGTANASATFAGDADHDGSTGTSSFQIVAAPTATAVSAPTITYAANGAVVVTVTSGSGTPTGNVSLTVDGGAPLTQALSGGSATFTLPSPNAGDHALVAAYAAQGNFAASTGSGNLHVNKAPTATTLTSSSSTPQAAGTPITLTATVVSMAPGSGTPVGDVTFYDGATAIGTVTVNGSGVAVLVTTTLSNGPHTLTAKFNESLNFLASNGGNLSQLIYGYPVGGGAFVIGNNNATLGNAVNFWGSQWEKTNSMTGGPSNASFKGFAISPNPPTVGATFTSAPGNSAPPPAAVPEYLGVIVTSKVTKSGSNITGTIVKLVVVKVAPGYAGSPGYPGNGTIVAILP